MPDLESKILHIDAGEVPEMQTKSLDLDGELDVAEWEKLQRRRAARYRELLRQRGLLTGGRR